MSSVFRWGRTRESHERTFSHGDEAEHFRVCCCSMGQGSWRTLASPEAVMVPKASLKATSSIMLGPQKDSSGTSDTLSFSGRLQQRLWVSPHPCSGAGIQGSWGCMGPAVFANNGLGKGGKGRSAQPEGCLALAPPPLPATSKRLLQRTCDWGFNNLWIIFGLCKSIRKAW